MSGSSLIAVPGAGDMTVWRVVDAGQPRLSRRPARWLPASVFCLGLLVTGGGIAAAWTAMRPDTVIRARIIADGATTAADRAALSDMALRLVPAPNRQAMLEPGGNVLVVTTRDRDPANAQEQSRSLVDTILNAPVAAPPPTFEQSPVAPGTSLRAAHARLAAAADAVETRAAAVSASLTAVARDLAARRDGATQKPGHETLDKGNAALADLQLQRLQLASKYQDTYPAVVALDTQIRNLRVFLIEEAHRVEPHPAAVASDGLLSGERDRLLAELSQLGERRRALAGELAMVDRQLASLPVVASAAAAPVVTPQPVLVAAATTNMPGMADDRPILVPVIGAFGLLLSALAALLARRRPEAPACGLVLEPVPAGALAADRLRTLGAPAVVLSRDDRRLPVLAPSAWRPTS